MANMNKTLVYLVCDLSGSMSGSKEAKLRTMAAKLISQMAGAEAAGGQLFEVHLVPFSNKAEFRGPWPASAAAPHASKLSTRAPFGGGTALRDAIGLALDKYRPHANTEVGLVTVISDGEECSSWEYGIARLAALIKEVEASGNLTLTFVGPSSAKNMMNSIGVPEANFQVWDGDERTMDVATQSTTKGMDTYIQSRSVGVTRSERFYADADNVSTSTVRSMTKLVKPKDIRRVTKTMDGRAIADFYGKKFNPGSHYYELIKPEYIQEDKDLIILIKATNEYRQGSRAVRAMIGLPEIGKIRVYPGPFSDKYQMFVQTQSLNRKVVVGQTFLTVD